jgi:hypothetical protein
MEVGMNQSIRLGVVSALLGLLTTGATCDPPKPLPEPDPEVNNPDPYSDWPKPVQMAFEQITCENVQQGVTWYSAGHLFGPVADDLRMVFSGNPEGTARWAVDDAVALYCTQRDEKGNEIADTGDVFAERFDNACTAISDTAPKDVTAFFDPELVTSCWLIFRDICGSCNSNPNLWLSYQLRCDYCSESECDLCPQCAFCGGTGEDEPAEDLCDIDPAAPDCVCANCTDCADCPDCVDCQ